MFMANPLVDHSLGFQTNGTERMRIHSAGGVSIGSTSSPGAGNLLVNGGTITTGSTTALSLATSGGTQFQINNVASAVNRIYVLGAATGNSPQLQVTGSDSNIGLIIGTAGSGAIRLQTDGGTDQVRITNTASAVNYLTLTGSSTTNPTEIKNTGTDAAIGMYITSKGSASIQLHTGGTSSAYSGVAQVVIGHTASANRYITLTGSNGANPTIGTSAGNLAISAGLEISKTAVTSPATTDGNVFSGTYTATLTNVTNIAASTAYTNGYMRVGNFVTVAGRVDIDPTAVGSITLDMTLPVASALTSSQQLGGTFSGTDGSNGSVYAEATGDTARFIGLLTDAGNRDYYFSFSYRVI